MQSISVQHCVSVRKTDYHYVSQIYQIIFYYFSNNYRKKVCTIRVPHIHYNVVFNFENLTFGHIRGLHFILT